jgi:hypothetical protein
MLCLVPEFRARPPPPPQSQVPPERVTTALPQARPERAPRVEDGVLAAPHADVQPHGHVLCTTPLSSLIYTHELRDEPPLPVAGADSEESAATRSPSQNPLRTPMRRCISRSQVEEAEEVNAGLGRQVRINGGVQGRGEGQQGGGHVVRLG